MNFVKKALLSFSVLLIFASCTSTKYYSESDINVVSQSQEDSSIHYIKNTDNIKSECTPDGKMLAFYTFGMPLVVTGCTLRECGRVLGYSTLNAFVGCLAYYRSKYDDETYGFITPDTKAAKKDYDDFQQAYLNSNLYKYRKYRKPLSKAVITKNSITEEVDWNDQTKFMTSTTETMKLETKVGDSASRVSKKASLIGCRVGSVFSVIFGIPSWVVGYIFGFVYDNAD